MGVASDSVFELDKGMPPVINQNQRLEMIRGLQCVSEADIYFALDFTDHLQAYDPNAMVISSTWGSEKRHRDAERWCRARGTRIIKLAYDQEVSTTAIKAKVRARNEDQEWLG